MSQLSDQNASKKATILSINNDLLANVRKLNIKLFASLEQALEIELRVFERDNWLKNSKIATGKLNELAAKNGLFSDAYRTFLWPKLRSIRTKIPHQIKPTHISSTFNTRYSVN